MSNFQEEFLDNYLKFGFGSTPKSDVDALVMHLRWKQSSKQEVSDEF